MKYRLQIQISTSNQILLYSIGKFFLILSFCLVSSCSLVPNELKLAEKLMETKPDSALHILQNLPPNHYSSESNRALYGLLLFQVLDKLDRPLQPDSLIDFSINFYSNQNDRPHLAQSYYYKARAKKKKQRYEDAANLYIVVIDLLKSTDNDLLLGRVYLDIGDICSIQHDYKEALLKYQLAFDNFKTAKNNNYLNITLISIGKIYHFQKKYKIAQLYYRRVLSRADDLIVLGSCYQEIGLDFYWQKKFDSAQFNISKSLRYPFKGTNYCLRCLFYGDLLFDLGQMDSSAKYALLSLKYPGTYYQRRDCYRILTNYEYTRNDLKQMGKCMSLYQDYTDSVRTLETQTKATLQVNLHNTTQETQGTKRNMIWIVSVLLCVLLVGIIGFLMLHRRNKLRKHQLDLYKQELTSKQVFVNQNLSNKIEEARGLQKELRKKASAGEREKLDKELYEQSLHVSNWDAFSNEMNHAFNNIVDVLLERYPAITHKEIIWCCLQLLDVPNSDRILILDATAHSLYKLKQRLAQKLNLKSTKELDTFLQELSSNKN